VASGSPSKTMKRHQLAPPEETWKRLRGGSPQGDALIACPPCSSMRSDTSPFATRQQAGRATRSDQDRTAGLVRVNGVRSIFSASVISVLPCDYRSSREDLLLRGDESRLRRSPHGSPLVAITESENLLFASQASDGVCRACVLEAAPTTRLRVELPS
jgi:hypothetical protein